MQIRLLTVEEVAQLLASSASRVYRLCHRRELATVGRGRGLRIRADSVERWIERNTLPEAPSRIA